MIHIGFTGTRHKLTPDQQMTLKATFKLINKLGPLTQWVEVIFHHGDCVGADEYAHQGARKLGWEIIGHPPEDDKLRAFCDFDYSHDPLPYRDRNRAIVDHCSILVACPYQNEEVLRSGTWSTIRYAKKRQQEVYIIFPDGRLRSA